LRSHLPGFSVRWCHAQDGSLPVTGPLVVEHHGGHFDPEPLT
jgi:hypothetical protein